MEGKTYQQLIGDVLFWHSVDFNGDGMACAVRPILTLNVLNRGCRAHRFCAARRDIAVMLRERAERNGTLQAFSLSRIGAILDRHHTTVLTYLKPKRRPWVPRRRKFEAPKHVSHIEQLAL